MPSHYTMEHIPTELLASFCMYPAGAAALAATCWDLRRRLPMPFTCATLAGEYIIASGWYTYVVRLTGGGAEIFADRRDCQECERGVYLAIASSTPPYVLSSGYGSSTHFYSRSVPWLYGVNLPGMCWYRRGGDYTNATDVMISAMNRSNFLTYCYRDKLDLFQLGPADTIYTPVVFSRTDIRGND